MDSTIKDICRGHAARDVNIGERQLLRNENPGLTHLKFRQWRRSAARLFVERTMAPIKDPAAIPRLLSYPIFLWLVFLAGGFQLVTEEVLVSWAAFQALVYTFPFFLLANLVTSMIAAGDQIKQHGTWFGKRFVFHEPLHVYTTEFGSDDDKTHRSFEIDSAEPNSFVQFHLEHYGGQGIASIGPPGMPLHGFGTAREVLYGSRINSRRAAALSFRSPKGSDPTIVRVYVVSWGQ